jgi:two-component system chemotaxis response regulator CheY
MISVGIVVDDDHNIRRVFSDTLRRGGLCILEAKSGREALKVTKTAVPHFVVTDLDMPDVDGLELCRRLRELAATSNVPIVVVSAAAGTLGSVAIAAGCDVVLPKPCPPALLLTTIHRLLAIRSGTTRSPVTPGAGILR